MTTLADQIRCVEREIKMRQRVYDGLVDRGKMSLADSTREIMAMAAVLETLKHCEQLADCLDKAEVEETVGGLPYEIRRTVRFTEKLVKQIAAQLRGTP